MNSLHITSPKHRIETLTREGWWGQQTLHGLLAERHADLPDMLAVADQPNRQAALGGEPLRLNFRQLHTAAQNLAADLLEKGVGSGDVVLVQLPNIAELVVTYFANSMIGAITSPMPVQYGAHEIAKIAAQLSPKAMITLPAMKATQLAEIARKALPAEVAVWQFDRAGDVPEQDALHIRTEPDAVRQQRLATYLQTFTSDANHTFSVCWTSGTTGTPKGVPRSHNLWLAIGRTSSEAGQLRRGDRLLNPFPLVNMAALAGFLVTFVLNGCSLILHHPFDPAVFLGQMQDERITFTIVPPALLNQMAKSAEMWSRFDFSELRRIGSGSAPLSPWMIDVFDNQYGKAIVNFYGSNEGISLCSTPEVAADPEVRASMFPRSGWPDMPWSGVAHDMVRNRVVRVGTEEEITEPGVPGELLFAGPTVFDGYLGTSNEEVFTSDGWFRTGDLVEICGEPPNYYRIVGRCKDIINRGGMKISPSEIDVLLEAHAAIAEAAVCAYPDENLGEKICACVVAAAGSEAPSLESLNEFLLQQGLAKFKLPERLLVLQHLPRNPVGKVQRHLLQEQVKDHG
ncbi:MAG: class I adenylate-forming enzyme family protein [Xanthomonadales bacterium]|nr:class I adenylate-forming enzyme family protein [Xanthomonadales bacterium]